MTDSGRGIPTRLRISTARARASFFGIFSCTRNGSHTCSPIFMVGFRLVSGSWKIMPTFVPRSLRTDAGGISVRSSPSRSIDPEDTRPPWGSRPISDRAVMVLPEPDSPTTPRVSPALTTRSTPDSARTTPERISMSVWRSLISRSGVGVDMVTSCAGGLRRRREGRPR